MSFCKFRKSNSSPAFELDLRCGARPRLVDAGERDRADLRLDAALRRRLAVAAAERDLVRMPS
jgi:hypothetical protein